MYLWAGKELLEDQLRGIKPKFILLGIFAASFLVSFIPKIITDVDKWLEYLSYAAIVIAFGFPFCLLVLAIILKAAKRVQTNE
jgi:hypothetical protein